MRLNAPKKNVFYISIALVVVATLGTIFGFLAGFQFWILLVGYLLLAAGNVLKGF